MVHYLLKWNPERFPAEKFQEYFESFERGEQLHWGCGNTKRIEEGDRFFLIKNGKEGRGIIGSGRIVSTPYQGTHFNDLKAKNGDDALYVDVRFDYLLKPGGAIPVYRHELDSPELSSSVWDAQGSGKTIPPSIALALEGLWASRVEVNEFQSPDEVDESSTPLREGAARKISVNAYERNAEARRKCINKWGHNCAVCRFRFDLHYGPLGKGYIHVHHLRPLSSVDGEYQIDPVTDLRPVCPNCHAMLHRRSPPLSIDELQLIVDEYRRSPG